jgi:hypothetical protein
VTPGNAVAGAFAEPLLRALGHDGGRALAPGVVDGVALGLFDANGCDAPLPAARDELRPAMETALRAGHSCTTNVRTGLAFWTDKSR